MNLDITGMNHFELKCISFKKQQPKILRVEIERKGPTKVFRLKMEEYPRITIKNKTELTFKINQKLFESYGEFISGNDVIHFFWDDPFSAQILCFQRLFNNQICDEKFLIDLTKVAKKSTQSVVLTQKMK
jgi:hypothetical protein